MDVMREAPQTQDPTEIAAKLRFSVTRLARLLRQQDQTGFAPTTLAALATIAREGPLTLGELAAAEQVAPPTITKSVAKLEDAGFVSREQDAADRRIHRVQITAEGRRQLEASRSRKTAWLATRLRQLDPEDLARLTDVLDLFEQLTLAGPPAAARPAPADPALDPVERDPSLDPTR
jgi:DNA-binding MarR family transcriptional regulator